MQDGFTHLTEDPKLLISVANHFYTDSKDDWLCLVLDNSKLANEVSGLGCTCDAAHLHFPFWLLYRDMVILQVKYEPAAPVGEKPRHVHPGKEESVFPHLFGGINKEAIMEERGVQRSRDGSFISVEGM